MVSPVSMRPRIIELINEERDAGAEGAIDIKVNGLTDPQVIDELYAASRAGVPIRLAVRGLCCLRPGIPELSETITVCSIVGEFLEHSRIFSFGRPDGPNGRRVLIGSSDLMERNLDRRIEATTPVDGPRARSTSSSTCSSATSPTTASAGCSVPTSAGGGARRCAGRSVQAELKALAVEQLRHWREQDGLSCGHSARRRRTLSDR